MQSKPLRAADLVPGRTYRSPSGRLCRLLEPPAQGPLSYCYSFVYLSRDGQRQIDDHFVIKQSNAATIAALREVVR
jgi:hypothetical protein